MECSKTLLRVQLMSHCASSVYLYCCLHLSAARGALHFGGKRDEVVPQAGPPQTKRPPKRNEKASLRIAAGAKSRGHGDRV
jgi:hypothetical protein